MPIKPFCAALAVVLVTIAPTFALPAARAATPPHIALTDGEPLRRVRVDPDNPSFVVSLNADGSLVVSQRDDATAITLPSTKALPAEIDDLLPHRGERKKLAVAVDSTLPYVTLLKVVNVAYDVGFGEVGILGSEKEPRGESSELVLHFERGRTIGPNEKFLLMSLGNDGNVSLQLGMVADAQVTHVNLAGAPNAAAGLVPKGRTMKDAFLRADFEVPVGKVLGLLRALRTIGFTKAEIVGEATE